MHKLIKRDPEGKPNTWHEETLGDPLKSTLIVFTCPNGHDSHIFIQNRSDPGKNWQIDTDGEVNPSIRCYGTLKPDCGYHEFVHLQDWRPEWTE
jgi:hypothetical protein